MLLLKMRGCIVQPDAFKNKRFYQMEILHNQEQRQFVTETDGATAHVSYKIHSGTLDIKHTIVPKEPEGKGIASALVKETYDYALSNGLRPMATCSYAKSRLAKHPEYTNKKL